MHSAWQLPEIRDIILGELSKSESWVGIRNLALSCRLLKDPSLDELRRDQNSLMPLLRVMGQLSMGYNGQLSFQDDPREEDWMRFTDYAKRVRTLAIVEPLEMGGSIFEDLYDYRYEITESLRPRRVRIDLLRIYDQQALAYIPFLLGDSVTEASFNFVTGNEGSGIVDNLSKEFIHRFLFAIARRCPNIGSLTVSVDETAPTPFEDVLIKFFNLTNLNWYGLEITPEVLEALAKLPYLRQWQGGRVMPVGESVQIHANIPYRSFVASYPHLMHLQLDRSRYVCIMSVLKNLRAPLEILQLRQTEEPQADTTFYRTLFAQISKFKSLRRFEFIAFTASPNEALVPEAISQLLNLPLMERLVLTMPDLDRTDDSLLLRMSSVWPRLVSIKFHQTTPLTAPRGHSPRMEEFPNRCGGFLPHRKETVEFRDSTALDNRGSSLFEPKGAFPRFAYQI